MRRTTHAAIVAIACALCTAFPASAQRPAQYGFGTGGVQLTPRVECDYQYADSGNALQRHNWIRSIVLWRGQPPSGWGKPLDTAMLAAGERAWRAEHRMAEDSGWTVMGGMTNGVMRTVEVRNHGAQLHVLGRTFAVPERDSVLVVMMDRAYGDGGPSLAGTTYVPLLALPDEFWPRMWTRGDTTFIVHPHHQGDLLAAALRKSPTVAAFMR